VGLSEKDAARRGSVSDGMRLITACCARALQRDTSRIGARVLLTFQAMISISKTRTSYVAVVGRSLAAFQARMRCVLRALCCYGRPRRTRAIARLGLRGLCRAVYGGWWWGGLLLAGVMGGCGDDDHDHHHHDGCVQMREVEPNNTAMTAQFLDPGVAGDCVIVAGNLAAATEVDIYRILIEEPLTLAVTLDHNQGVDFAVQVVQADTGALIQNCNSAAVLDGCEVSFAVHARALPVLAVVTSVVGAGPYTLTLDVQ
jgi:hypothetical protein